MRNITRATTTRKCIVELKVKSPAPNLEVRNRMHHKKGWSELPRNEKSINFILGFFLVSCCCWLNHCHQRHNINLWQIFCVVGFFESSSYCRERARGTLHHMCDEQAPASDTHSEWCNVHICFRDWLMFVLFCRPLFLDSHIHSMAGVDWVAWVLVSHCV